MPVGCDDGASEAPRGHEDVASVEAVDGGSEDEALAPPAWAWPESILRRVPLLEARGKLDLTLPGAPPTAVTKAPLAAAYCQINVNGVNHDTETDYIPHVIQCENGGAKLEALKAQAIAARSVAYYAMAENGKICDGQGCQVYSCGAQPAAIHYQAAMETAGQYLSYNNTLKGRVLTYAFYVAGDNDQTASCKGVDPNAGTEPFVTYNEGKTGTQVSETTLGFQFKDPNNYGYGQNRGCMSQWSARCLENNKGYDSTEILRYFYGADIEIQQAPGPCVAPVNAAPEGALESGGCDAIVGWAQDPDVADQPIDVTVSFLGAIGDGNAVKVKVAADVNRPDLCDQLGSCDHGFSMPVPRSLRDGQAHPVHAYAHDDADDAPTEVEGSPQQILCAPPSLPAGVRRWVPSPAALAAWNLDPFWLLAKVDEATLLSRKEWKPLDEAPTLVRADGAPELWLVEGPIRRLVGPLAAEVWGFSADAAAVWPIDQILAIEEGTPVRDEIFLVQGGDPAMYVLDDLNCPSGGVPGDPLCPTADGTTGGTSEGSGGGESTGGGGTSGSGGADTEGGASVGGVDASGGGGGDDSATGPSALPPGYGQGGIAYDDASCECRSGGGGAPGWWAWWVLVMLRRRRIRAGA